MPAKPARANRESVLKSVLKNVPVERIAVQRMLAQQVDGAVEQLGRLRLRAAASRAAMSSARSCGAAATSNRLTLEGAALRGARNALLRAIGCSSIGVHCTPNGQRKSA